MKKIFFFAALAAVALASCSSDETVATNDAAQDANAISFRAVSNSVTRTSPAISDADALATNGFYAAAYEQGTSTSYFAADLFSYDSGSYKGTKTYYWPAFALDFYAWYPNDAQLSHSAYNQFTLVPSATLTDHKDFIIAATLNRSKPSPIAGVPLAFKHLGAWIDVQVYNSKGTAVGNLNATVSGWKIGYLHKGGVYTIAESTADGSALPTSSGSGWSYTGYDAVATNVPAEYKVASLASNFVSGLTGTYDEASESVSIGEAIIVPQATTKMNDASTKKYNAGGRLSGAFIALKLQIVDSDSHTLVDATSVDGSGNDLWAIWPINNDWVAGTKYTYKIDLSQGGYKETGTATEALDKWFDGAEIYFSSVVVTDWSNTAGTLVTP